MEPTESLSHGKVRKTVMGKRNKLRIVRAAYWILRNWLVLFLMFFGLFNLLPFLAPIMAKLGFDFLADIIYLLYTPLCHQMAHRSFFLFGDQLMYRPEQLPLELTAGLTGNMLEMKQFVGNETIGWKVAWSDRMVYMYGAVWIFAAIYAPMSRRYKIKHLSIRSFVLLMLPMAVDGVSHVLSDASIGGLIAGFRYTNEWLADLTINAFPAWFYAGDALGSFNSWMRLISGLGFGVAIVWMIFPMISTEMRHKGHILDAKLRHAEEVFLKKDDDVQSYIPSS